MTDLLMRRYFLTHSILWICLIFAPSFAFGDSAYRSKCGLDIKGFKANNQMGVGWLAGVGISRFLGSSNASIGLSGYFGTPQGGNPRDEHIWYTGATVGYDGRVSKVFIWQTGLLVGLGMGKYIAGNQESYYTIEPSAGMGFALGGGIRLTFNASYIHMTNAQSFSGTSFGIRIEYKTQTQIKEVND